MARSTHSDAVKAEVVAALLTGQGVRETARLFKLPASTVQRYKNELGPEIIKRMEDTKVENLEQMLMGYLVENIKALTSMAKVAADPTYSMKQPASELATLHGVMADKMMRLVEAINVVDDAASRDTDESTDTATAATEDAGA